MNDLTEERFCKIKNTPIKIVVFYLIITLILYSVGVFDWKTERKFLFYFLQVVYIISLWLGYRNNINKAHRTGSEWNRHESRILRFLPIILVINIFMFLIDFIRSFGYATFTLTGYINSIIFGFFNMGAGYSKRLETAAVGGAELLGGNLFTLINLLWFFIELNGVLLGILYFKKAKFITRFLVIINIFEVCVYYISVGTNIGLFRILLAIGLFGGIGLLKRERNVRRAPNMKRVFIIFGIVGIIVICFFIQTLRSRGGILYWDSSWYNVGGIGVKRDSVLFQYLPTTLYLTVVAVSSYLTQGYQAFAYSLNVSWTPMFGLGQSYQIVQLLSKYIFDLEKYTYQYKIEQMYGWSMSKNWASAYTWMANDVSVFGVPVILYLIGKVLALTYKESMLTDNAYSKIIFYFFVITCIFLPCNYQVVQFAGTYFAFIFAFIMWIASTRIKFKINS